MLRRLSTSVWLAVISIAFALSIQLAFADKTVTQLTTGSQITSLQFDLINQPGKVIALACGRAPLASGGMSNVSCYSIVLTSGSIFTSVNTLATGTALTFWQQQEGL